MNKIIIHWTASSYTPNATDLEHYHFLIDGEGQKHNGKYKPEDNENCYDGAYAAHTGGGNTGAIGVSMCAMAGFKSASDCGRYPITPVQLEACFKLCAELCKKYALNINPITVMTHYEFGKRNPQTSSAGKIDITYLPSYPDIEKDKIGDFIRAKVRYYYLKINS